MLHIRIVSKNVEIAVSMSDLAPHFIHTFFMTLALGLPLMPRQF